MGEIMDIVSVVIPCYNDGEYIKEAVLSVKNQTYKFVEIVVVDDGSTDRNTIKCLDNLDKDILILRTKNIGPAGARNMGIKNCKGKYILPLDADDKIATDYIEKALKIIKQDNNIGAVYCYAELFGERTGRWMLPNYSFETMIIDNIVFVTALFRKEDWVSVGGYCEDFKYGIEDYDFWLSILELNKYIVQIPEVLFYYRIKPVSRTTKFGSNYEKINLTYDLIYDRHKKLYEENMDLYCKGLRKKLIEKIRDVNTLQESIDILAKIKNKINKFPLLKSIVKFVYKRMF